MRVCIYVYACRVCVNFVFTKVDRGEYWKRHDREQIIHKNAFVGFTSRSIDKATCVINTNSRKRVK